MIFRLKSECYNVVLKEIDGGDIIKIQTIVFSDASMRFIENALWKNNGITSGEQCIEAKDIILDKDAAERLSLDNNYEMTFTADSSVEIDKYIEATLGNITIEKTPTRKTLDDRTILENVKMYMYPSEKYGCVVHE